jgi:16S rRNA (guanine527-N7)-methyltransferase
VTTFHSRAEEIKEQFDFVVSRAVTAMPEFLKWVKGKFLSENKNKLRNGILYLKGGDLKEEMKPIKQKINYNNIQKFFDYEFFETKKVVYIDMNK